MSKPQIIIDNLDTMVGATISKGNIIYYIKKVKNDAFLIKMAGTKIYDIINFREFIDDKYGLVYYNDSERNEFVGGHDDYEFFFDSYLMERWYKDVFD